MVGPVARLGKTTNIRNLFNAPVTGMVVAFVGGMEILVPISGVQPTRQVADYIMEIALAIRADVLALSVVRPGHATEAGELGLEIVQQAAVEAGVPIETELRRGLVVDVMTETAETHEVDLIVLGASEGLVLERWLASEIRDNSKIPVVQVPFQIFPT